MNNIIPFKRLMTYQFRFTMDDQPYRCTIPAYSKSHALRRLDRWFSAPKENIAWVKREPVKRYAK